MKPRLLVVKLVKRLHDGTALVAVGSHTVIVPETFEGLGTLAATVWEKQDRMRNRMRA